MSFVLTKLFLPALAGVIDISDHDSKYTRHKPRTAYCEWKGFLFIVFPRRVNKTNNLNKTLTG